MIKRTKFGAKQWLSSIKKDVLPQASKNQPYRPQFKPWAVKNYKKFYCKRDSHSFKSVGGKDLFLLDRGREAMKNGFYTQPWLKDDKTN